MTPRIAVSWQAKGQGPPVSAPPWPDKEAKDNPAPPKAKHVPKKKIQVIPTGGPGEYTSELPHICESMFLTHI